MSQVYMVISPDPRTGHSEKLVNGVPTKCFWVKIGDGGESRISAYRTENPSFHYSINANCPTAKVTTVYPKQKQKAETRPGKFLEMKHINIAGGYIRWEGTEWHELRLNDGQDINDLRTKLCTMIQLFPLWDSWVDYPDADVVQAVNEFHQLVDKTWNCEDGRAIATFRS